MCGPGEAVAEVRELELPGPGGPMRVRSSGRLRRGSGWRRRARTVAAAGADRLPLVAYAHGGGWAVGSLDAFDPLCRALANAPAR